MSFDSERLVRMKLKGMRRQRDGLEDKVFHMEEIERGLREELTVERARLSQCERTREGMTNLACERFKDLKIIEKQKEVSERLYESLQELKRKHKNLRGKYHRLQQKGIE